MNSQEESSNMIGLLKDLLLKVRNLPRPQILVSKLAQGVLNAVKERVRVHCLKLFEYFIADSLWPARNNTITNLDEKQRKALRLHQTRGWNGHLKQWWSFKAFLNDLSRHMHDSLCPKTFEMPAWSVWLEQSSKKCEIARPILLETIEFWLRLRWTLLYKFKWTYEYTDKVNKSVVIPTTISMSGTADKSKAVHEHQ